MMRPIGRNVNISFPRYYLKPRRFIGDTRLEHLKIFYNTSVRDKSAAPLEKHHV